VTQRKTEQVTRKVSVIEKPATYSLATSGLASLRALALGLVERVAALEAGVLQRPLGSVRVPGRRAPLPQWRCPAHPNLATQSPLQGFSCFKVGVACQVRA
jgi:hypothetical protein